MHTRNPLEHAPLNVQFWFVLTCKKIGECFRGNARPPGPVWFQWVFGLGANLRTYIMAKGVGKCEAHNNYMTPSRADAVICLCHPWVRREGEQYHVLSLDSRAVDFTHPMLFKLHQTHSLVLLIFLSIMPFRNQLSQPPKRLHNLRSRLVNSQDLKRYTSRIVS